MREEEKEIELRCEEVQEILTRPPRALVRWGITVFFTVLLLFFIGGCFFKYPDTVNAEITITTEHPPIWMVAKGSGKIKEVYCKDRERVEVGKIIATLENPAKTGDVLQLEEMLTGFEVADYFMSTFSFPEHLSLGSVQNAYATFLKNLMDYRNFLLLNLYEQKVEATQKELQEYRRYIFHLNRQTEMDKKQTEITSITYDREKKLFEKGLISQSDYEEVQQVLLNKQQSSEQLMTSLSSAKIREAQLLQNIIEIRMEQARESNNLSTMLKAAFNELQASIENWKMSYLFVSPIGGILSYNHVWQKNQNVNSGDKVFSIVAEETGDIIGKMKLPVRGSGKVKPGQWVNISVDGYPYLEFGFLIGKVMSVSLLADDNSVYTVTVSLPKGLCFSYGHQPDFKGELIGTAEVMTEERSLTSRLLSPFRYLWEKHF